MVSSADFWQVRCASEGAPLLEELELEAAAEELVTSAELVLEATLAEVLASLSLDEPVTADELALAEDELAGSPELADVPEAVLALAELELTLADMLADPLIPPVLLLDDEMLAEPLALPLDPASTVPGSPEDVLSEVPLPAHDAARAPVNRMAVRLLAFMASSSVGL